MNLEEVIPALRDGKIITRVKSFVSHDVLSATIFVKMVNKKLQFKFSTAEGDRIDWQYYSLKSDDVLAENWTIINSPLQVLGAAQNFYLKNTMKETIIV